MSEETSKMEVDSPPRTDIAALKEVAKEKLEQSEASDAKSDDSNSDNDKVANGDDAAVTMNGDSNGSNGNNSHESEEDGEEAEVEAPEAGEQSENGNKSPSKEDEEVETITSSPMKPTTPKKGDNPDVSPRRSGRKKTPTKYQEMLEAEKESSEEEIEEVEEIKDDDSDIQEVEADESPLTAGGSVTITPKNSSSAAQKKPNVVTIDDLKTLQKLATTAKASMDREKSDRASAMDTQSIIAGKMGSGVSITPAKPKTPAPSSSSSSASSISNMSPAGMTLGSGVTIRPNKPAAASSSGSSGNGVSIVPVDKSASSHSSSNSGGSGSSTAVNSGASKSSEPDPNLTDDTYVVEAPSFIVPYVYEKPPKEGIKSFKESIDKIVQDKKAEKEKKRAAGEEVSDDEEEKKKKEDDEKDSDDSADEEEKKEKKTRDERAAEKAKQQAEKDKKGTNDYFGSTLGKYFIDLGMNLVQEFVQKDLLREQQRRSVKDKSVAVIHAIKSLEHNLEESKEKNEAFHFGLRKCKFCSFRTESRLVLENHMETPHMRNFVYRCNFCDYETKIPQEVLFHMESEHGIKGKLERAPYYHQCPQCPFEDNSKGKLTRHKVGCDKRFKAEENQKPDRDWDPPAKIRPPPVRPGSFTGYMNYQQKGTAGQHRAPGSSLMQRPQLAPKPGLNRIPIGRASSMNKNQMGMRGMTPQMLASQQMLAVLNQQGLSVSGVKGLNSMMLGNNQGKSGSVTIQVSAAFICFLTAEFLPTDVKREMIDIF